MKKERHAMILRIISDNEIHTQDELQELLEEYGVKVTQATLSRDMHELRLTKQHVGDTVRYVKHDAPAAMDGIIKESILGADFAGHMIVIHCRSGMAQAACAAFDAMKKDGVVGTIAGDDTVFVLMREEKQAEKLALQFRIGNISDTD